MFKVIIKNQEKNLEWNARFESKELAQEWLDKQIGKPHRLPEREISVLDENGSFVLGEEGNPLKQIFPAEFSSEIIDISEQVALEKAKAEAKQYLLNSDWYVIRFIDSGVEIPSDVKQKRQDARGLL